VSGSRSEGRHRATSPSARPGPPTNASGRHARSSGIKHRTRDRGQGAPWLGEAVGGILRHHVVSDPTREVVTMSKDSKGAGAAAGSGAIYGLGIFGAWVYFFQQAPQLLAFHPRVLPGHLLARLDGVRRLQEAPRLIDISPLGAATLPRRGISADCARSRWDASWGDRVASDVRQREEGVRDGKDRA
jgi:hypothetical protein